ncbi:DUF4386 domain-containing protein [Rhodanobacter glycinis]|uniref:DUF4386 domain-containing protein n=1 Tax=Rhodanobacter glycinis TaxID=582702 RepID=A0A1I3Y4V0_9GAMM|nr:DUF4386 domain-containing protein [Rhodanobacter glycinis]SFK26783.1 protein of unknown function [Rhodanobacter glycinis]
MTSINRKARIAGFIYLLCVLIAPYRLVYIPNALFVTGNASATAANIAAHETIFRLGIFSDLLTGVIQIFLGLAFYRLFKEVNRKQAMLLVIVSGILIPAIYFFNVLNDAAALLLVHGADFLSVFSQGQREALAMLFLKLHGQEVSAAEILWGLWLFPLAALVLRSGFLPRVLGYWLILNGVAYVMQSFAWAVSPQIQDTLSSIAWPIQFGEVVFMLWLLIMGARSGFRRSHVPAQSST